MADFKVPDTMRAIMYSKYSDNVLDVLEEKKDVPVPKVAAKSVLIRVHAAAINPVDYKLIKGWMQKFVKTPFPAIPGFDVSGVVVAVGSGCTRLKVGDAVYADTDVTTRSTLAEYVAVPEAVVSVKPSNLSFAEAASLPLVALTSFQSIYEPLKKLKPQSEVLILGGSSATGMFAVQLAKAMGARVTTTCSARNVELVTQLGADQVVDYTSKPWAESVKGQKFSLIYDCVGAPNTWNDAQTVAQSRAHFVTITGDRQGPLSIGKIAGVAASMTNRWFWSLFGYPSYHMVLCKCRHDHLDDIRSFVEKGQIRAVVDKVYPLSQTGAREAFEYLMSSRAKGKLVFQVVPDVPAAQQ